MTSTVRGLLALSMTIAVQSVCFAQTDITQTVTTTSSPTQVLDSYMKPTIVRTRAVTDADGNTEKIVEPMVLERHEHVLLPSETTTVDTQATSPVTEVRQVSVVKQTAPIVRHTALVARRRKVAHHVRPHHRIYTAQQKSTTVTVAEKVIVPRTVETKEVTERQATVIERRDPALDLP